MRKPTRSNDGSEPATSPTPLRAAIRATISSLAFWSGAQLAGAWLERSTMLSVALQAAVAEWGAAHIGVAWSDPGSEPPDKRAIARRAGRATRGAAMGGAVALLTVLTLMALGETTAAKAELSPGAIALGLVVAGVTALRDELFLRGMVLRVTRTLLPNWAALLACAAATAAARFGEGGDSALLLSVAALRGVALAALWIRDRGAWMAWGANLAWTSTLGAVAGSGFLNTRFAAGPDASSAALAWVAIAAASASWWALRAPRDHA